MRKHLAYKYDTVFEKYLVNLFFSISLLNRDPVWKYLQTVQYGAHGNFPRLSYPTFFPRFEFQDIIPPDDFLTSDEELDSILFGTLRGHVVGLRYYTGVVSITLDIKLKWDVFVVLI